MNTNVKKLLIVTDAWQPQINGVVRTLTTTIEQIVHNHKDWEVRVMHPRLFHVFHLPGYSDIEIPYEIKERFQRHFYTYHPQYIHIAVEGRLGWHARAFCKKNNYSFTTAYHIKFPEFIQECTHIPAGLIYPLYRRFHKLSSKVMVAVPSLQRELEKRGFKGPFGTWSRGVDTVAFSPVLKHNNKPYAVWVGRVSHEKNVEVFCKVKTSLKKVIVGDGPQREALQAKYKNVDFVGWKQGKELSNYFAQASVFAFTSKTDTFGLTMVEALACGTPVVAFDISSPCDVITPDVGLLVKSENDFGAAMEEAVVTIKRDVCRQFVLNNYTWKNATNQFLNNLIPVS